MIALLKVRQNLKLTQQHKLKHGSKLKEASARNDATTYTSQMTAGRSMCIAYQPYGLEHRSKLDQIITATIFYFCWPTWKSMHHTKMLSLSNKFCIVMIKRQVCDFSSNCRIPRVCTRCSQIQLIALFNMCLCEKWRIIEKALLYSQANVK